MHRRTHTHPCLVHTSAVSSLIIIAHLTLCASGSYREPRSKPKQSFISRSRLPAQAEAPQERRFCWGTSAPFHSPPCPWGYLTGPYSCRSQGASPSLLASLFCPPPKPLRSFSLLLSGWTLTLCPPTNGLCCQLFCSICSRSKCAQREGLDFRSQMQVSKINGPLTLPRGPPIRVQPAWNYAQSLSLSSS